MGYFCSVSYTHLDVYKRQALTGTDARTVRPYSRYSYRFDGDGRTDRASLQPLLVSL